MRQGFAALAAVAGLAFAAAARFIATTPQSFAAFQRAEADKWAKAIHDADIKVE